MNAQVKPVVDSGIGTLSFVADSDECFGQVRYAGITEAVRGVYTSTSILVEGKRFTLALMPSIRRTGEVAPALRGNLLDRTTGESVVTIGWAPTKGGKAYGLSIETPMAQRPTHLPF